MFVLVRVLLFFGLLNTCLSEIGGPPRVEETTLLLDSYIPPSMQILAYLTEMMKYDLRPSTSPPNGPTTTSTVKPTQYHRPGVYAPLKPPGPDTYYQSLQKGSSYRDYVDSLKRPSGLNYFDRYKQDLFESKERSAKKIYSGRTGETELNLIAQYLGKNFLDTYKIVDEIEIDVPNNVDEESQQFLKKYDDSDFRSELLRQKQVPPTRAYVTLLSLYDTFNKESKRQGLSKYHGYPQKILKELADLSTSTSAYQLQYTLKKVVEHRDTSRSDIIKKVNQLVGELDDPNSYINVALKYIPPLVFAL
ncbi:uncharacterized protein ImpE3 [Diabrotica undecimpunctata]|uniref:uncharacterized protein ImpE3 n=1 Tax=Diabrotica undecimpunctata TaxID=50387 RepID=UPI003B633BC4